MGIVRWWKKWIRALRLLRPIKASTDDPERITELAGTLGVSAETMRQLVHEAFSGETSGPLQGSLQITAMQPFDEVRIAQEAPVDDPMIPRKPSERLGRKALRLLFNLLDLPISRSNPALTADLVVHLADAVVANDDELLQEMEAIFREDANEAIDALEASRRPSAVENHPQTYDAERMQSGPA